MSSRAASLTILSSLLTIVLVGCPSRFDGQAAAPDAAEIGTTEIRSPDDVDASAPDAASAEANVAPDAVLDVVDSGPPSQDDQNPSEQPTGSAQLSPLGAACRSGAECTSAACVDGVCCGSSSCGACLSCAITGSLGTCAPLPKLTEDPKSDCTGTMGCDGAGTCSQFNGNACKFTSDCLSGFCVDGVCCESACDQQCFSCNTGFQVRGMCRPLIGGTDPSAATACDGRRSCSTSAATDVPACLLNNGESCDSNADCASGQCSAYYYDADGDTYGDPSRSIKRCDTGNAPPASYTATAGDCCDADPNAHPGVTSFFQSVDSCGSYDYDCDGSDGKQHNTGSCAGYSGVSTPDCGTVCTILLLRSQYTAYTQACR
jgi:hypothetical protein